jgi:tetratricopeptide (TPR) repeat protein
LQQATALWQLGRFDEALNKYQEAVRRTPNDFRTLIEASRAFGHRYRIEQSTALLNRAERLGARRAEIQHAIGETYAKLRLPGEAEVHFRKACRLDGHPRSLFELAKLCERRHAIDEADELVTRVLRVSPNSLDALILRARLLRRRGDVKSAEALLTRLAGATPANSKELSQVYGELSTLLDEIGEFDCAWDAMLRCKAIQSHWEAAAWQAGQFVTNRFRQLIASITPQHFSNWKSCAPVESCANLAILTGFPRSGTTLLEQVLDAHPAIISIEEVETFNDEAFLWLGQGYPPDAPILNMLEQQSPERIVVARERYWRAMESLAGSAIDKRMLIDKNPAFNLLIPVFRNLFPETKLIVALRDPRDVVVSCFLRHFAINPVSAWFLTLERTVERYLIDMSAWLKLREMTDEWVEVRYEDVVVDMSAQAARTLGALGIPWDDGVLNYRQKAKAGQIASPTYEAVSKPIYASSIGRWRNYKRWLEPVLDTLTPMVKALGYEV